MYVYIYATTVFYNLLKNIENPSVYMTEDPLKKPQDGPWFGGGQGGEGVRTHDLGIRRRKRWSLQLTQRQSTSRPCLTAVVVDDDNVFLFKLFCNLKKMSLSFRGWKNVFRWFSRPEGFGADFGSDSLLATYRPAPWQGLWRWTRYSLWTMGIKIWIRHFHMKSLIQLIYQPVFFIHRHCFCWHCTKKWGTDCSHSAWGSGMNRGIYLLEIDLLFSKNKSCWNVPSTVSRIHCKIILIWWMFQISISISEFVWGATRRHVCVVRISTDCLWILL